MNFISTLSGKKVSISIYTYEITDNGYGGTSRGYDSTAAYTSNDAIMYDGASAERVVSEKIKTEISAIILIDYFTGFTDLIKEKDKIVVGTKEYTVISIDDIGHQNEVLQIAVKEFK